MIRETYYTRGQRNRSRMSPRDRRMFPVAAIIEDYVDSPRRGRQLQSRFRRTVRAAERDTAALEGDHPLQLVRDLLRIISTEREIHRRTRALALLSHSSLDTIEPPLLLSTYLGTTRAIGFDSENTGPIGTLLRAGEVLAPHFVEPHVGIDEMRRSLARPWMQLAGEIGDEDMWRTIAVGVFVIQHRLTASERTDDETVTYQRRRQILENCSSELTVRQLDLRLAENGFVTRSGQLAEDLEYLAGHGIDVLIADPPVARRKTARTHDTPL